MRFSRWLMVIVIVLSIAAAVDRTQANEDQYDALKRFSQVLNLVEDHYVREIPRKELIDDAIKGLLQQLDPHSTFLSKEEFREMQISTSGEFGGIGIEISLDTNGRLVVVSPIEDTPAYQAGLKSGDIIVEIDGQSTQDLSLTEAVKRIRGPKGSPVKLTVVHKDSTAPFTVEIVRAIIPILSVKSFELDPGYLLLRLTKFNENTTDELVKALAPYEKGGKPLKGIILDLRNNPGGLLNQSVSVADVFLDKGLVVYIQGKDKDSRKDFMAKSGNEDVAAPMVVLINAGTASASEIVAGALQDHNRALLLGERTFGKGSVQTVIPMADGSGIKLTTALYYTPSGRSIQAEGIVPDLKIPFEAPAEDRAKDGRLTLREQDLARHLENGTGKSELPPAANAQNKELLDRDNQLRLALELVKELPRLKKIQ